MKYPIIDIQPYQILSKLFFLDRIMLKKWDNLAEVTVLWVTLQANIGGMKKLFSGLRESNCILIDTCNERNLKNNTEI